ncbi:MAG: M4 family metallopeptidase [Saprospiraceae bacterium]
MQKFTILLGLMMATVLGFGQFKPHLSQFEKNQGPPHQLGDFQVRPLQPAIPVVTRPFGGITANFQSLPMPLKPEKQAAGVKLQYAEHSSGPIAIWGTADPTPLEGTSINKVYRHLHAMEKYMQIKDANATFKVIQTSTDEAAYEYLRLQQYFAGVKVYGGEIAVQLKDGQVDFTMGRYFPTPLISSVVPTISENQAIQTAKADISKLTKITDMSESLQHMLQLKPVETDLVIYHKDGKEDGERLAWQVTLVPNIYHKRVYFVDAHTGNILVDYNTLCKAAHHLHTDNEPGGPILPPDGRATASKPGLRGISHTVHSYIVNNVYYMIDASRPMFNANGSNLPDDPAGAIWTIDAQNQTPINNDNFEVAHIASQTNNDWAPGEVSAHYNAGVAYEYFWNTFSRKSINGQGGTIISIINVTDEDGGGFDNAFWSGSAMFYGNGKNAFTPLAGALDVAGHEMSHGVVQTTANLEYQSQSGALNESFADIFGAMIDREDWKMGEDVVRTNVFPSGALRDLSDPHNGGNGFGSRGWQPAHMNEYVNLPETEDGDNGGVHVNSGIPNKAFFLFASQVGKEVAEQVYYHALVNYLTRFSQFVDLRLAILQSAAVKYNQTVVNAAANAFNQVGIIGNQGSGNEQEDVQVNPGDDFIVFADGDKQALRIVAPNGSYIANPLIETGILSKPSVTDDGSIIVFVDGEQNIQAVEINWATENASLNTLTTNGIWRNAVISKDGRRLAATTDDLDNRLWIFNLETGNGQDFELYNPSTAQGVNAGNVDYADILEWDFSGEYVMYDALSKINTLNGSIPFWDIGFIRVWNHASNNFGDGYISKLFTGLPDNTSVGNPSFSKNSPFIIAFDWLDEENEDYFIRGADTQKGELGTFWNNLNLGFPNYAVDDKQLIFDGVPSNSSERIIAKINLAADKINANGNATVFLQAPNEARWGVWFGTGSRNLTDIGELNTVDSRVKVYPNPFRDQIRVELELPTSGSVEFSLYDGLGRQLKQLQKPGSTGLQTFDLDWNGLPGGTYWLSIQQDGQRWGRRVVKIGH